MLFVVQILQEVLIMEALQFSLRSFVYMPPALKIISCYTYISRNLVWLSTPCRKTHTLVKDPLNGMGTDSSLKLYKRLYNLARYVWLKLEF